MWQEKNVVMLPCKEKAENCLILKKDINRLRYNDGYLSQLYLHEIASTAYHLYITSNEQPNIGDWCYANQKELCIIIDIKEKYVIVSYLNGTLGDYNIKNLDKIIATTDKQLTIDSWKQTNKKAKHYNIQQSVETTKLVKHKLPLIPQHFITYFIEQYNIGNIITKCNVEYISEMYYSGKEDGVKIDKLVIKDNTISIQPIKDSWNREEVIVLLNKFKQDLCYSISLDSNQLNEWIKENL